MTGKLLGVLVALVLVLAPGPSHALTFSVDSATVNMGDTFAINVNVADAVDLTSWQFDLGYDASILQATSVTEGLFLSSFGTTLFSPGFEFLGLISGVSDSFVDPSPYPSGNGVLATIQFTALTSGISALTLSNVFANFLTSDFTVTNGSVCGNGPLACDVSTSAPEPSSLALMLVGGLGVWGLRRWNRTVGDVA